MDTPIAPPTLLANVSRVHVALTRTVREGREAEFEAAIARFFTAAAAQPGSEGAYLIRPVAGGPNPRQYGILRAFATEADKQRFYESQLYRDWTATVAPMVEDQPRIHELHGLEAFFREAAEAGPPPAWKMAVLTWIAVNPAVYIFAKGVPRIFGVLPPLVELLVVNLFVVATLTWAFMPALTRVARPWLAPEPEDTPT